MDDTQAALRRIIGAYDAYRRRGASPAPAEYADVVAAIDSARAALAASPAPAGEPVALWRCFHCDEVFSNTVDAAFHFGYADLEKPACLVDAVELRNLQMELTRNARLLQMVLNDIGVCYAECGADYQFRELSTETVDALNAASKSAMHLTPPAPAGTPEPSSDACQLESLPLPEVIAYKGGHPMGDAEPVRYVPASRPSARPASEDAARRRRDSGDLK